MDKFGERQKGFEAEFVRNQELAFRVTMRRNRLFGLWAAGRQGLSGSDAQQYAARLACEDSPHYRARAVLDRVARDLVASGYAAPEDDLATALAASADRAQADVWAAGVAHRFG